MTAHRPGFPPPRSATGHRRARGVLATFVAGSLLLIAVSDGAGAATRRTTKPARRTTTAPTTAPTTTAPTTTAPTTVPTTTSTTTPPAPAFQPSVSWVACGTGLECGALTVPLDYANPAGTTVTVNAIRRRATDPVNRIGVLIANPGGPGGSAVALVRSSRFASGLPAEVAARFDIVGIDPRGIQGSIGITCPIAVPTRGTPRDEASRAFAGACASAAGTLLPFVGTDSAAEDIESMRIALGEQQISYLGFSYGTYLGTLYLQRYPERVRAAILDAAVDGSVFGVSFMVDQMRGYERTLGEFLTWCQATPTRCPFATVTPDVRTRYDEMQFIAARTGIGRERIAKQDLEFFVSRLLGESWSTLGRLLADLSRGSTASSISVLDSITGDPSATYADGAWESIACRDGLTPSARPADPGDRLSLLTSVAPHFTDLATYWATEQICSTWPTPPRTRATPQPQAVGRVMVIGNTLDVRTPLEWAQRLAQQLGAPLVTYESYRHTAATAGDPCVAATVSALLVSLLPPGPGIYCASSAR